MNVTGTASPCCLPGSHLGDEEITLNASVSSNSCAPRSTDTFRTIPSTPTVNCRVTRPWMPFCLACSGYFN